MSILLSTLNARYAHSALGLRYLKANMGVLQSRTELMEFVIGADVTVLAKKILSVTHAYWDCRFTSGTWKKRQDAFH